MYNRYSSRSSELPLWLYGVLIVAFVVIQQLIAHGISENNAVRAAEGSGYTNVKVIDRHTIFPNFQGCGKEDMVMFDVTGTDAQGVEREMIVCDGLFKAATVRFK